MQTDTTCILCTRIWTQSEYH